MYAVLYFFRNIFSKSHKKVLNVTLLIILCLNFVRLLTIDAKFYIVEVVASYKKKIQQASNFLESSAFSKWRSQPEIMEWGRTTVKQIFSWSVSKKVLTLNDPKTGL